ncbi:alpha/beta fold hydrolase [Shouchella clausii]|uniref:alpha/beta fold hydrolase n=1 Tax=Shouchella clausii TaxID=79880 RepID=UPI000B95FD38|nr:alpha/beta hydrolase [Shouchella clausii]AST96353.1 alpha/beta hydrolase [Shouchella clausii]MEB5471284.1 alpha/beta hydrolase [Shouchella clausii]QNM42709.1 alpha/beta hydrolase [Shouchella clausii]WQG94435.1 alpha/beta hydrolase [Shouchella clausii]
MDAWNNFQLCQLKHRYAHVNGIQLHYVEGGEQHSNTVVLLHGFPQSWVLWRFVIPDLVKRYRVLAIDLRGYGDSDKPEGIEGYTKANMAKDINDLVTHLRLEKVALIGHDRGARVARRFALDYPDYVAGLCLIDILPLEYVYDNLSASEAAKKYWHWVFQVVAELPEALIAGREEVYLGTLFRRTPYLLEQLKADGVWDEYVRIWKQPGGFQAALNDYRAAHKLDLPNYRVEKEMNKKINQPCLLLWGENGNLAGQPVLDIWKEVATMATGKELAGCGHYVPEEQPAAMMQELAPFLEDLYQA